MRRSANAETETQCLRKKQSIIFFNILSFRFRVGRRSELTCPQFLSSNVSKMQIYGQFSSFPTGGRISASCSFPAVELGLELELALALALAKTRA